ncbi:molybdate ABC transporter substrate-binding protein [Microbacterium sp. NPDC096154]|uniref:molybdate ABC transporter substrate-binding protein n=1 Tax=Microbacterium sp. NPDC096154 TaxID=3155549 RepID=UPI0033266942
MRASRPMVVLALTIAAAVCLPGCAARSEEDDGATRELTVYAAASLGPAFDEIASAFERSHAHVDVRPLVLDGSQVLATQLAEGAPADVFASADEATMGRVADLVHVPRIFAANTLVIAVPPGNPAGVRRLADLARSDAKVVLCAPEVPCGSASRALLGRQGVDVRPVSWEQNVGAVVAKVAAGEVDAGLVYRTDAVDDRGVDSVSAEGAADVINRYPIASLRAASEPEAAQAFIDFVVGEAGQRILAEHGFAAP